MAPHDEPVRAADDCAWTGSQLAAFLAGELSVQDHDRLHRHLAACPACRREFAEAVDLAAHLNRQPRRMRAEAARQQRRKAQRARALSAAFRLPGHHRRAMLRLLVIPALAIFLLTGLTRSGGPHGEVHLEALEGQVFVGQDQVPAGMDPREVPPGQVCSTGERGRGRLTFAKASAELEPGTLLWLERSHQPRLRLGGGALRVRGSITLTSRLGVVQVLEGEACVRLGSSALELQVLSGDATASDSRGERRVAAGSSIRLPDAAGMEGQGTGTIHRSKAGG